MKKSELLRRFFAGTFFVMGIALTIVFVLVIGKDKGLAQSKFQVDILFKNVGGLMEGAPARLSGVNVGNVGNIDFLEKNIEGRRVKVTLNVFLKYKKQFEKEARFAIKTEGILGEKLIEIYAIEGAKKLDLTKPIIGEDAIDVQDLAQVFADAASSFTKTSEEISQIDMVELTEIMSESSKALLETSMGINAIMEELQEIARKSKRLIDRIEQRVIDGDLFKVF